MHARSLLVVAIAALGCATGGTEDPHVSLGDSGGTFEDVAGEDATTETSADANDSAVSSDAPSSDVSGDVGGDSAVVDSTSGDTKPADGATTDTATTDTAKTDTATTDTAKTDTATTDTGSATDTGAGASCTHASDCGGSKCVGPTTCSGALCFACGTTTGTTTAYGTCTASGACASGVCDQLRSHCSAPCPLAAVAGDTECASSMGSTYVCTEESLTLGTASGSLGFCAKRCGHDADCSGTDVCQSAWSPTINRIDIVCGPPGTGLAFGSTCVASSDCASGVCLQYTSGTTTYKKCSALCIGASDCSGALTKCGTATYALSGGKTQTLSVCTP